MSNTLKSKKKVSKIDRYNWSINIFFSRSAEPRQSLDRISGEKSHIEEQLREKVREMIEMQDEFESEKTVLKQKVRVKIDQNNHRYEQSTVI